MAFWPFKREPHRAPDTRKVDVLQLAVSRERTKLYANIDVLDRVTKSDDFTEMVQRSLRLMGPKK